MFVCLWASLGVATHGTLTLYDTLQSFTCAFLLLSEYCSAIYCKTLKSCVYHGTSHMQKHCTNNIFLCSEPLILPPLLFSVNTLGLPAVKSCQHNWSVSALLKAGWLLSFRYSAFPVPVSYLYSSRSGSRQVCSCERGPGSHGLVFFFSSAKGVKFNKKVTVFQTVTPPLHW